MKFIKSVLKWVAIVVGCFVAVMVVVAIVAPGVGDRQSPAAAPAAIQPSTVVVAPKIEAPLPQYTAGDLARAYEENSVAADAKFKGKRYRVSGTVVDISTDFMGDPYVTLRGGVNQFLEPRFAFDKKQLDSLSKLRKGQKVVFACEGRGDVMKSASSSDCSLL